MSSSVMGCVSGLWFLQLALYILRGEQNRVGLYAALVETLPPGVDVAVERRHLEGA